MLEQFVSVTCVFIAVTLCLVLWCVAIALTAWFAQWLYQAWKRR